MREKTIFVKFIYGRNYFHGRGEFEGDFIAKGLCVSIYTEAETMEELRDAVKDAVHCHFDDGKKKNRLHIVKKKVIAE